MQSPHRILVPVDFSEPSRAALEYAAVLGAELGAEVDVLHVFSRGDDAGTSGSLLADFARSDAGHTMVEWLASCEKHGVAAVHGRLAPGERGDVPSTIVEVADHYDLIVMGTHGRHGLARVLFGRVADSVARRARCPVVTVNAGATDIEYDPGAGGWS